MLRKSALLLSSWTIASLCLMLVFPQAAWSEASNDVRDEIHNFTQVRLQAGRCEKKAAAVAIQLGDLNKTDKEMIQFVLDACKGELNLLGLEYKKSRRTDEQINKDFLTEIAWLLGLAPGERECRQVSPR
jgi:hypothetical protein